MQTALLIFIVIFALAIGFFLGLFLLSLDAPFLKRLFQKEAEEEFPGQPISAPPIPGSAGQPVLKKPTPGSKLILQVWKEEGRPPLYEVGGEFLAKEALPREILNVISIHDGEPPLPKSTTPEPEKESKPEAIQEVDEEENEVKMLSVVDEVNDILQRKLHGSPMAGKGIHLMENHNKEIRFWVGLDSYNDVSEIPDPEIRKLIDDAVREWEQNRG